MPRILVVANRTAATPELVEAVRSRAGEGVSFHLVVPKHPHGLHRVVDPEDAATDEEQAVLDEALPRLSEAAGVTVTGEIGDAAPLSALEDAFNREPYDEIVISTLPARFSRWLKLDLVSKAKGLGVPVAHVEAS